jgi:hypothetical protein
MSTSLGLKNVCKNLLPVRVYVFMKSKMSKDKRPKDKMSKDKISKDKISKKTLIEFNLTVPGGVWCPPRLLEDSREARRLGYGRGNT